MAPSSSRPSRDASNGSARTDGTGRLSQQARRRDPGGHAPGGRPSGALPQLLWGRSAGEDRIRAVDNDSAPRSAHVQKLAARGEQGGAAGVADRPLQERQFVPGDRFHEGDPDGDVHVQRHLSAPLGVRVHGMADPAQRVVDRVADRERVECADDLDGHRQMYVDVV